MHIDASDGLAIHPEHLRQHNHLDKVKLIISNWLPLHCLCQWPHPLDAVATAVVELFNESERIGVVPSCVRSPELLEVDRTKRADWICQRYCTCVTDCGKEAE